MTMPKEYTNVAPWLDWMIEHVGEIEKSGDKATEFDKMIFTHTNYGPLDGGVMVAGCSATACAALEINGFKSPHNAAAISFKDYGDPCELKPGCIVVFEWADGSHHVSFCYRIIDDRNVECLGGNQSHLLQVSTYNRKFILATRWPTK